MFSVVASTTTTGKPENRPEPEILDEESLKRVVDRWRGHEHVGLHATGEDQIHHFKLAFSGLDKIYHGYRDKKLSMKELQTEVIKTHEDIDTESLYNMLEEADCNGKRTLPVNCICKN